MIKRLLAILALLMLIGCKQAEWREDAPRASEQQMDGRYRLAVYTIDGCEYIMARYTVIGHAAVSIIHKQNCGNHK